MQHAETHLNALHRPAPGETWRQFSRRWWLREARLALRRARWWAERLGGPLHDFAFAQFLGWLQDADRYRTWAHEIGLRHAV